MAFIETHSIFYPFRASTMFKFVQWHQLPFVLQVWADGLMVSIAANNKHASRESCVCVPQLHHTRSHIHSRLHCIPSTLDLNCLTGRHLNRGCLFSVAVTPHLRLQEQNVFVVLPPHCSSRKLQPALEWAVNLRLAKERGTRTYYTGSKVWSQELIHC